ncbi:unnamed protein product [Dovyalis caffra]|uniref:Conserved oligomeric Golgi complex subunit 8 n=1 Tax=Dovyalis caffra TaxID=77055 RepID=A0AAV1SKP3_9ROSI|nr:unnamed protein product [Dovyalis caffra]
MEITENGQETSSTVTSLLPLASVSQQPYVSELLSFTLDRLHKEPELLRVDAERIQRQMQEVAVGNYRAFIAAADALLAITEEVSSIDNHLESLITEIPKLTFGCTEFIESAEQILEKRKMNQTLLANHSTLLDLLEIPQLMDTCVRNGNYDEALDLEAFVCKLSTMHPKLPVIQALAAEVRQTTQSLLFQLLQKLRSNIQLPECLRIIGYLRRIGVFSEYEMRLQFLRCREAWLTGILEDLDQRNAYEYLKGMINCHRMHLFDVVNQYRAIFADDTSGSEENYDGGLLFSWAMHQITSHLKTLKIMLPKITEGGSLSNILDSCMYCAVGLNWVGLDFRGLLPPLFEEAVLNLFSKNMSTAVENFQLVLDSHRWVPLPAVGFPSNSVGEEHQEDVTPPSYLMEHPPLAVFINGVSAAMNELRPCAPVSLKHVLAQKLIKGLQAVSDSLLRYNTTRMLRDNESGLFLSLCRAFIEVAYPHCAMCFGRCYPGGAALIMDAKNLYDGIGRLLATSSRELPRPANNIEGKNITENGDVPVVEDGVTPEVEPTGVTNADEKDQISSTVQTDEKQGDSEASFLPRSTAPFSVGKVCAMESNVEQKNPSHKLQIYSSPNTGVTPFWREKYERDAKKYWDVFYKRHQDKFFKDRHYLDKEWGQYFTGEGRKVILEIGCGAGNTIFPLVATYPNIFVYACDFSPRAVNLVKTHKDYLETRVGAFVCDLTVDDLSKDISPSSVDIVTMIFVLSAVSPEKMPLVLQNVKKILKPNGYVLLRDYAVGDLAQERFTSKDQQISENFYVRGDGTRAFYFSNEFLTSLFKDYGFDVEELGLCCKQVENRSREIVMNRRWIQAVFRFSDSSNKSVSKEPAIMEDLSQENVKSNVKESMSQCHSNNFEVDMSEGVAAEMFGISLSNDNEVIHIKLRDQNFKINVLSKEYQHTCKSTGMMLWESARMMASVLAVNPTIVEGKKVLELGCGCGGICSMVAAKSADLVVATDGDTKALELLAHNVASNLRKPSLAKLITKRLEWGNREHIEAIKELSSDGFEVIIGTDVTYVPECILPLFATAKELISCDRIGRGDQKAVLILCHIFRRVDEPSLLSAASQFGFKLVDKWPLGIPSNPSQSIVGSWFPDNGREECIPNTALNIMYFQWQ